MNRPVADSGGPRVFEDQRGRLVPMEFGDLNFTPQRVFVVVGPAGPATRGGHDAGCRQRMVLVSGSAILRLSSRRSGHRTHELREPGERVLIEPDEFVSYDLMGLASTVLVLAEERFQSRTPTEGVTGATRIDPRPNS